MTIAPIIRELTIAAPIDRVFDIFTKRMGDWVPAEHSLLDGGPRKVIIEPILNGSWYEVAPDGTQKQWGRVARWTPPTDLGLIWQLNHEFQFDPNLETFIDVSFTAQPDGHTFLRFVHHGFEAYGQHANDMRSRFDTPRAWSHWLEGLQGYLR